MDWKEQLQQLKAEGSLPPGEETPTPSADIPAVIKHKGKLHIAVEKKGRGGKTATIIYGFNGTDDELQQLASALRHSIGTGGSARGGEILLQGDCSRKVTDVLRAKGYKV